jgi:hypothetical protein
LSRSGDFIAAGRLFIPTGPIPPSLPLVAASSNPLYRIRKPACSRHNVYRSGVVIFGMFQFSVLVLREWRCVQRSGKTFGLQPPMPMDASKVSTRIQILGLVTSPPHARRPHGFPYTNCPPFHCPSILLQSTLATTEILLLLINSFVPFNHPTTLSPSVAAYLRTTSFYRLTSFGGC